MGNSLIVAAVIFCAVFIIVVIGNVVGFATITDAVVYPLKDLAHEISRALH